MNDYGSAQIESRLKDLEKKVDEFKPKKKDRLDKAQTIASILTPFLTFALGFVLINRVNLGLERQRFQISSVKEMQGLLEVLRDPNTTDKQAENVALALAAFGPAATTPLLMIVESGEPNMIIAGEWGLRAVGMSDPKRTCEQLIRVVSSRSPLYSWFTHRTAIRVVGDLTCENALTPLDAYDQLLKESMTATGLTRYRQYVRETPAPTVESIGSLQTDLDRARGILSRATGRTE